jgi:hypothetical protein
MGLWHAVYVNIAVKVEIFTILGQLNGVKIDHVIVYGFHRVTKGIGSIFRSALQESTYH